MKNEKILSPVIAGTFDISDVMTESEEIITAGNSFFDRSYFGTRVLVIAPRPGDEILIAGNMILNLVSAKAEIFIAYAARKYFSVEALEVLGLAEDKIIFFDDRDKLKKIISDLKANVIFCADYDRKVRYKKLSTLFESVLGEILIEDKFYRPEVYKKFARCTSLNCPPDFYAPNLFSTKRPVVGITEEYDFDIIDRINYSWDRRVRFPVPEICQGTLLKDNPLSIAVSKYTGKRNNFDVLKILNGDEIFFERRTDNQAYKAEVSDAKVCDFNIVYSTNAEKINFVWSEGVQVQRIVVYGSYKDDEGAKIAIDFELDNLKANISAEKISVDNKFHVEGVLPIFGRPLIIDVEKIFVRRAEVKLLKGGKNFGISEVEFLPNVEPLRKIQPFIKLTAADNFIYKYFVPMEMNKVLLSLYRFHVDEAVRIVAETNGERFLNEVLEDDDSLAVDFNGAREVAVTAEVIGNPNIYDRVIIRRVTDLGQIHHKMMQWMDKIAFAVK